MLSSSSTAEDVEKGTVGSDYTHLINDEVKSFSWEGITVTVKDRISQQPLHLLSDVSGMVEAGEMMALMGPSGSGKTTLLNILAHRAAIPKAIIQQSLRINGQPTTLSSFRKLSSYVEQEDALIGSLTVRETLYFAAELALPSSIPAPSRKALIASLISSFGLLAQANTLIGTPIRKGVSGGQKRRVSVASQLIASPRILFLDEPTSGLDSAASYEVIKFVRDIAKKYKILVIASIHQPSTSTFGMFDKLMLLSKGKVVFNGGVEGVKGWFGEMGYEMPLYTNPAEFVIDLVNTDFAQDSNMASERLTHLHTSWTTSTAAAILSAKLRATTTTPSNTLLSSPSSASSSSTHASPLKTTLTLIHRSFIKSHRDIVAYGIRIAMYLGLAIMMGTVWLRLSATQSNIQAFTNAIFFGGAFMSFMAVAYIPAYLEDLALYTKERANGIYGPTSFILSNFIVGVPYLFLITILFSAVSYWLGGFRPSAEGFCMWVLWLFLDLLAAESLVVLLASLVPIFVVALAATAFANGLWMCVNGFMVQPDTLNPFWRYVFHYIDYQAYVFRGMMVNEFGESSYACEKVVGGGCQCMYPSQLQDQCLVDGKAVLGVYGFETGDTGKYVGYLLVIVAVYRLLGWMVLYLRKH